MAVTTQAPPLAAGNWLLGSAVELLRSQVCAYERFRRDHGDVVRIVMGPPGLRFEMVYVFHPDGVRQVLAGPRERYSKRDRLYEMLGEVLGWGLLTSDGERWQRQRRLLQPLFTRKQVGSYAELMAEEALGVAARWERPARSGDVIDANAEMTRLALCVVGRSIFGDDVEQAAPVVDSAFAVLNRWWFRRTMLPVCLPTSWPTPGNLRGTRAQRALYGVVDELIARRERAGAEGQDLLSLLLRARDPDTGAAMDVQQVRDEALVFLLAGHETTSTALTLTLWLLARHPAEQQLVHDELDSVLAGRTPTAADAQALARTTMVINETMRLYPPAYLLARRSEADQEIGGYAIPAGITVGVSQYATHRHPAFWQDPDRFAPDRFAPEREAERHPYAYFPFGRGPRACIGLHFAMLEAVIAVAVLLQRYRVTSKDAHTPVDTKGITLRPKGPILIGLTPRPRQADGTPVGRDIRGHHGEKHGRQ